MLLRRSDCRSDLLLRRRAMGDHRIFIHLGLRLSKVVAFLSRCRLGLGHRRAYRVGCLQDLCLQDLDHLVLPLHNSNSRVHQDMVAVDDYDITVWRANIWIKNIASCS